MLTSPVAVLLTSLLSVVAVGASPNHKTTSVAPTSTLAACAIVSSLSAAQIAASPSATPIVDAALAYECLDSVPLNKTAAIALVDASVPYINWQSSLAYLKAPPPGYFYPPHDVLGTLATVRDKLVKNHYVNEYAFQRDFYQVFAPCHDGHFILYPDLLTRAFEWGRQIPVVSISRDGKEIPKIYSYDDVIKSPASAPALVSIDGVDASTYIQDYAYTASFNQDADSAYNTMFHSKAFIAGGLGTGYFSIKGRVRYIYPGASTTYKWSNGTSITLSNVAHVKGNFAGVTSGPSFYEQFCTPEPTGSANAEAVGASTAADVIGPTGYPPPVVSTNDTIVSGYYLEGEEFSDVAVLSLLAMESESPAEFQAVVQDFLADAVASGKKKLVVDLSANGGGYILQGYDTFRQLFPHIQQRDYTRIRESPDGSLDVMAEIYSAASANFNPLTASEDQIGYYENFLNYRYDYNLTEESFPSFESKFAPHRYAGDEYTSIIRWNFNDPLTTINSTYGFGIEITGYGTRSNFTQPFAAEDIILLYDGYCASTCIIFSEFMKHDAGVKSIAMGGRPNRNLIQGMGGIKGAESYGWTDVYSSAQSALPLASPKQAAILNEFTTLPMERSSSNSINLRDLIIPEQINTQVPAQFLAEEADCRLYYTAPMVTDVTKIWEAAAHAAWGGGKCAAGGLKKRDAAAESSQKRFVAEGLGEERKRAVDGLAERGAEVVKDSAWLRKFGTKVVQ